MEKDLFNQEAVEYFDSPDDLSKCIKMTTPAAWMVTISCLLLILGVISWGLFGVVSTYIEAVGMVEDGYAICFIPIEDASKISLGNDAIAGDIRLRVRKISATPRSKNEAAALIKGDYLLSAMMKDDWAYAVEFDVLEGEVEKYKLKPVDIRITTKRTSPIGLIFER